VTSITRVSRNAAIYRWNEVNIVSFRVYRSSCKILFDFNSSLLTVFLNFSRFFKCDFIVCTYLTHIVTTNTVIDGPLEVDVDFFGVSRSRVGYTTQRLKKWTRKFGQQLCEGSTTPRNHEKNWPTFARKCTISKQKFQKISHPTRGLWPLVCIPPYRPTVCTNYDIVKNNKKSSHAIVVCTRLKLEYCYVCTVRSVNFGYLFSQGKGATYLQYGWILHEIC